ncbi:sensor histidine kinase [Promicromonospora sukumoe]|uniref:sensor histidine kinase n=1 Tax=Promicromonospora sukumoe TaxID=88382 RepID=UPI00365AD3DD
MPRLPDVIAPVAKVVMAEDRRGDVITAASLFVLALALDALGLIRTSWSGLPDAPSWWFVIPAVVGCTALIWRRVHPLGALGVATVAFVVDIVLGGSVGLVVIVWEALYAVHLHGTRTARRVAIVGVTIAVVGLMTAIAILIGGLRPTVLIGLQAVTLLVMPMWWGTNVRQGRELTAAAHERERLERERGNALLRLAESARHDAVRTERTTVARDLHDVVASHLSAIAITSGAALAGDDDPERDRAALRSIRAESLASLQDMQSMIRVLRADAPSDGQGRPGHDGAGSGAGSGSGSGVAGPDAVGPSAVGLDGALPGRAGPRGAGAGVAGTHGAGTQGAGADGAGPDLSGLGAVAAPRGAQLGPVIEQARIAGLDLNITDPVGVLTGSAGLPVSVDQAVYRVVREALTNVHRHGGGSVDLSFAGGQDLAIEVHDHGPHEAGEVRRGADAAGTGLGLVSMRERVEALGGSLAAGPERGGWRVRAVLPLQGRARTAARPAGSRPAGARQSDARPTAARPAAAGQHDARQPDVGQAAGVAADQPAPEVRA